MIISKFPPNRAFTLLSLVSCCRTNNKQTFTDRHRQIEKRRHRNDPTGLLKGHHKLQVNILVWACHSLILCGTPPPFLPPLMDVQIPIPITTTSSTQQVKYGIERGLRFWFQIVQWIGFLLVLLLLMMTRRKCFGLGGGRVRNTCWCEICCHHHSTTNHVAMNVTFPWWLEIS